MPDFKKFDFTVSDYCFIITIFLIIVIGHIAIYSVSYQFEAQTLKTNFSRQLVWLLIGTVCMSTLIAIPSRVLFSLSYWIYGISLFLLFIMLIANNTSAAARWMTIGGLKFQPSEVMKIGAILVLARYLSNEKRNLKKFKDVAIAVAFAGAPFVLISRQPDLGTALVFLSLILPVLYWAGLPIFSLLVIIIPLVIFFASFNYYAFFVAMFFTALSLFIFRSGMLAFIIMMIINIMIGIITPFMWNHLKNYQKHRIMTFLGLEIDPHGASYQLIQSKVAIGSGGFWGKGIFNGTQTQLRFLPAQHTDFVFSVIGEELGFIGSMLVLGLFLFVLLRGIYIASIVKNKYLSLLVIGAVIVLGFHVIINIGMTVGIAPVTGIPLPLMSYGGTFLITSMILVGFIIHASIRRFRY